MVSRALYCVNRMIAKNLHQRTKLLKEFEENILKLIPGTLDFQLMPVFKQSNCLLRQPDVVSDILRKFISAGPDRLQVISDFDQTITRQQSISGDRSALSSFSLFRACQSLSPHIANETLRLFHKYQPIELDENIPLDVRMRFLDNWNAELNNLLTAVEFDHSELTEIVSKYESPFRMQSKELFDKLNQLNIPLMILSAGLGDSIVALMKRFELLHPNIKIVSNFLRYKNGLLDGFQQPMVHTCNKNAFVHSKTRLKCFEERDCVIVMGDTLGDAKMISNMSSETSHKILKIGYLSKEIDKNVNAYMNAFDIVLIDDETLAVPIQLIHLIEKLSKTNN